MNSIVEHFISGEAFFSGISLIIIALILSFFDKKLVFSFPNKKEAENSEDKDSSSNKKKKPFTIPLVKLTVRLLMVIGVIFILLSSTPVPIFIFNLLVMGVLALFIGLQFDSPTIKAFLNITRFLILVCCILAVSIERDMLKTPEIVTSKKYSKVYILGDSLTMGVAYKHEKTWAEILAEKSGIAVKTYAVGGGRLNSAIDSADKITPDSLIILEIGGNDILGINPSSLDEFSKDLDTLLNKVMKKTKGKSTIIMVELPLPPFFSGYSAAQRSLAAKYGVYLIPKSYLASIICNKDMTVDGLHLSNKGHEKMAEIIWKIAGECLKKGSSLSVERNKEQK